MTIIDKYFLPSWRWAIIQNASNLLWNKNAVRLLVSWIEYNKDKSKLINVLEKYKLSSGKKCFSGNNFHKLIQECHSLARLTCKGECN